MTRLLQTKHKTGGHTRPSKLNVNLLSRLMMVHHHAWWFCYIKAFNVSAALGLGFYRQDMQAGSFVTPQANCRIRYERLSMVCVLGRSCRRVLQDPLGNNACNRLRLEPISASAQVLAHSRYGRAADLWSFGCVVIAPGLEMAPEGCFQTAGLL